ncbi:MAG: hypothetical protein PHT92_01085 [Bacteroidales bacterium]|nr:hypothetical protein [Bacteroidales bacterium]
MIVDGRSTEMFNAGHIANAVNIYAFSNEASNEMGLSKAEGEQSMAATLNTCF